MMDTEHSVAVENFLKLARSANNKQEFFARVKEFDQRFTDSYPTPNINPHPSIPKSTHSSHQQKPPSPPKNPFINTVQEKYRQTSRANNFMPPPPQRVNNIVHTRSQQNFYKPEQTDMYGRQMQQLQANFVNQFGMEDPTQRNQIMDRSFPNFDSGIKTPVYDGRGKNNYMDRSFEKQTPPIQNNEFLSALDSDEPQYVKYYKKMVPTPKTGQNNFYPQSRTNPFKA